MMLHPHQLPAEPSSSGTGSLGHHSKRKAYEPPDGNERLSKRLSLLNLEQGGAKLYVPVESNASPTPVPIPPASAVLPGLSPIRERTAVPAAKLPTSIQQQQQQQQQQPFAPSPSGGRASADDAMQVDDSKYKVYIYNLDDELASDESSPADSGGAAESSTAADDHGDGKLVFLPDIDKHLRAATAQRVAAAAAAGTLAPRKLAVPRPVLPNEDGELAGMQLVLYHDPSSLTVPREHDSVRQAILDVRARIRQRQREERQVDAEDVVVDDLAEAAEAPEAIGSGAGIGNSSLSLATPPAIAMDDPDAMDID